MGHPMVLMRSGSLWPKAPVQSIAVTCGEAQINPIVVNTPVLGLVCVGWALASVVGTLFHRRSQKNRACDDEKFRYGMAQVRNGEIFHRQAWRDLQDVSWTRPVAQDDQSCRQLAV